MTKLTAAQLAALGLSAEQIEGVLALAAPKQRRRARHVTGTRPKEAIGLLIDGSTEGADSPLADWRLYMRPSATPDWIRLKLVRSAAGDGPGNYWLCWNIPQRRFAKDDYFLRLPDDMRAALEHYFDDTLPRLYGGTKFSDFDLEFYAKLLAETDATDLLR